MNKSLVQFFLLLSALTLSTTLKAQQTDPPQKTFLEYPPSKIGLEQISDCMWIQAGNLRDFKTIRYQGNLQWDEIGSFECRKPEYSGRNIAVLVELPIYLSPAVSKWYEFELKLEFVSADIPATQPPPTEIIGNNRKQNILPGEHNFVFLAVGNGKSEFKVGQTGKFKITLSVKNFQFLHRGTNTIEKGSFEVYNGGLMKTYLLNQTK